MVLRVLDKTGTSVRAREMIYKAVVWTVLLYGIKIWVMKVSMMKVLELFHHCTVRRLTGKNDQHVWEEGW